MRTYSILLPYFLKVEFCIFCCTSRVCLMAFIAFCLKLWRNKLQYCTSFLNFQICKHTFLLSELLAVHAILTTIALQMLQKALFQQQPLKSKKIKVFCPRQKDKDQLGTILYFSYTPMYLKEFVSMVFFLSQHSLVWKLIS